jgi:predicted nucleotide-binding protein (sugar kinase/HSP70/actin superfamily)
LKVTFPHFGNTFFAAKAAFDGLGIDYAVPPLCNKEALEIGSYYSPEEMCLPFKIMIGNYIQGIKEGADTVLTTGSCGPCRFGEYCELQMDILKKLGYDVDFIVFDAPKAIGKEEFLRRVSLISNASSKSNNEQIEAALNGLKVINLIDDIEKIAHIKCGYEINKGESKKILNSCKREIYSINNPEEVVKRLHEYKRKIKSVPIDLNKKPITVGIVGEIYTIAEPFSNLYIEDKLMDYGVCIKRKLSPSWWVKNTIMSAINMQSLDIRLASRKYLPLYIGGHGRECVGETVLSKREGCDGVIQIFPLGCMPEIVSKSILPTVSKDLNMPVMTLIVDEMTGETGYMTRIEAFLDLLERRKSNNVLSWS